MKDTPTETATHTPVDPTILIRKGNTTIRVWLWGSITDERYEAELKIAQYRAEQLS